MKPYNAKLGYYSKLPLLTYNIFNEVAINLRVAKRVAIIKYRAKHLFYWVFERLIRL